MPNKERFYDVRLTLKAGRMAEPSVIRVAERNDWFLNRMGNRKAEIYLDQWITPDEKTDIRYIEDPLTGLPFVTIRGEGVETAERLLRESCDLWEFEEALQALETPGDRDATLTAIYATAYTAPPDPVADVVNAFNSLLCDSDPAIRQAIVVATGYAPWPQLVDIVRHLAETDPVDHVRNNARILLEGLEIHGEAY
ncbi:HEAT repeat domain-containing protein [Actinoallomurus sp. NBC_01490]|jgi:hypothetical protein|uniref:HEAT repeat domain-containing protein n=1 Tax=Actinoallomurus sp. NBC_01490 TaxID=2903557 RepID=UPI002E376618|nr:HEAT repeat domain-containing protein [Actinoallomurus sp. NBC_01490]